METYGIIYNPVAGKKKETTRDIEYMKKCLGKLDVSYKLFETEYIGHAMELASELAKDGYRVIGAGGDGTCNEVMNGAITSNTNALCGFIPMGSGNDIPAAIGIVPDIKRACEIIAEGNTNKVDIGFAKTDTGVQRYFLGIGSQGFDSEVTRRFNEAKRGKSYVTQTLKALLPWKNKQIKVTMDNDVYEGYANLLACANGPSYGGFMYICQRAQVNDGFFHVNIVDIGKFKLLRHFNRMYKATLLPHPNIYEYTSKKVRVEMLDPEDPNPYICQVDGEILDPLPVNYECIKEGYEFIQPKVNEVAEAFKKEHGRYFWDCNYD
ncbi:MAG: diacylglycerol/lipid kinase family protein [Candidatus Hermodarchaeota archaeon]